MAFSSSQFIWGREVREAGRGDFSREGSFFRAGANMGLNRLVRQMRRVGFGMKWEEYKSSIALVLSAGQKVCLCQVLLSP